MADLGECQEYPWFQERIVPFRYRFCENYERLMDRVGREVVDTTPRVRRAWDVPLRFREEEVVLKVYEESVNFAAPNCEQCRCNGWQHHPVCTKKIHFIIPSPTKQVADVEMFDSKLHVLHGMVHVNGFGHLMRINGLEGGSKKLRGEEVMKMWDALCRCLRVRDVTVEDVSNKRGMLLRVLLPIAHKSTFYMRHGYRFGRGQFNVKEEQWKEAVEKLNGTSLDDLLLDFDGVDETVQKIILRYNRSGNVRTLGGLMENMMWLTESEDRSLQFAIDRWHLADNVTEAVEKLKVNGRHEIRPTTNGICSTEHESEDDVPIPETSNLATETTVRRPECLTHLMSPASELERSGSEDVHPPSDQTDDHQTIKKQKKRVVLDDPGDLERPKIVPFNAASLFEGSRKYSATKMVEIIRITLGVLQGYEDRWVRLQELRDILYDTAHDRVLADFVLGRMANTVVNGFSIIKQRSKLARCNYYLFEKYVRSDGASMKESFLSQVEEPALPAPGPEVVNGQSLERFESYLGLLFKWMCHQPHVSIGRGPNKNRPKPKRKEPESEKQSSSSSVRMTRSAWSNASKRSKVDPPRSKMQPWMEVYPSEVSPHLELLKITGPQPGMPVSMKRNILADLLYLYQSILEGYRPMIRGTSSGIRLGELPKYVLILRDSKFFVKRFQSAPIPGKMERNGEPGLLRLVCQVTLNATIPPGLEFSRLKDDQPIFFHQPPPPEEVFVPIGASMVTVKSLVEEAFGKIYAMFDLWSVGTISNLKLDNSYLESPSDKIIEVKGHMFRPELELRHSGGIEDWEVLCRCGTRDDDGARMLCCDRCSVWMHTRCVGFRDDVDVPSFFQCNHCRRNPQLHSSS